MAKQTKSQTAPANPSTPAEKGLNDKFVRVLGADGKGVPANKPKVAPQLQCIANTIEAAGLDGITRADLVKALTGVIVTRQPVGRIVSYYQKDLQVFGLATLVKQPVA